MKAKVISVKPRHDQALQIQSMLVSKGYDAEIIKGFNYEGEYNAQWKEILQEYQDKGFFYSSKTFADFINLCIAISHSIAINNNIGNPVYSLVLEDDVQSIDIPDAVALTELSYALQSTNIDIVFFDSTWERLNGAFLEPTVTGKGKSSYLVKNNTHPRIFSKTVMNSISNHFTALNKERVISTYISHRVIRPVKCKSIKEIYEQAISIGH